MAGGHRIGNLVLSFKEFLENGKTILDKEKGVTDDFFDRFETLFTKPTHSGDYDGTKLVNAFSNTPLDTVCVDLMIYDSDSLFEAALNFMSRRWGQRKALLGYFPQVSLLIDQNLPVFGTFRRLDLDLQHLRYYIRSYNIWGVETKASGMDEEIRKRTNIILNKLLRFIYSPSSNKEEADAETVQLKRWNSHKRASAAWGMSSSSRDIGAQAIDAIGTIICILRNLGGKIGINSKETSPGRSENRTARRVSAADLQIEDHKISDEYVLQLEKNLPPSFVLGSYGEDVVANTLHQDILRNMGMAREVLFHALTMDYTIMEKVLNDQEKADPRKAELMGTSKQWLYEVLRKTIFILSGFVDGSTNNQQVFFTKLDVFRERLGDKISGEDSEELLFCWDVVISIFQGNVKLSRICPETLIQQYAKLLAGNDSKADRQRLIDFFINICNPSEMGKAIVRNQDLCMKFLVGNTELISKPVLTFNFDRDEEETITKIVVAEVSKCLQVLAFCSKEKNNLAAAKSQAQLTIDDALLKFKVENNLPNHKKMWATNSLGYKSAIMDFLHYVYVDTSLRDKDLARKKKF